MTGLQRVALIVGGSAAAAGAIGLVALRLWCGSSLRTKLIVVAAPAILSTAAGPLCTGRAGLVSSHARAPVVEVCIAAGLVVLEPVILLAHRVTADLRVLRSAMRAMGEGAPAEHGDRFVLPPRSSRREHAPQPVRLATAELTDLGRALVAAEARLSRSRDSERAEQRSRRELMAKATLDLHARLADLRALAAALEEGVVTEPAACYARVLDSVGLLTGMVDDLFELCGDAGGRRDPARLE